MQSSDNQFIHSLTSVSVAEVFEAIEHQCRTAETITRNQPLTEAENSILVFRRFLNAVMLGVDVTHNILPDEHLAIFRATTAQLLESGTLPKDALEKFDRKFSSG